MTLKQLASVLPGYVQMAIHTDDRGWVTCAGANNLPEAQVVKVTPIAPYQVEVHIKLQEEFNQ